MKGKIISFSPHRRRGLIMVRVRGEESMEYQHLQFDSNHYDASIETHLYKDQEVQVELVNYKPGTYKVSKIYYDIGKNLYKRSSGYSQESRDKSSKRDSNKRLPQRQDNRNKNSSRRNYQQNQRINDNKRSMERGRQRENRRLTHQGQKTEETKSNRFKNKNREKSSNQAQFKDHRENTARRSSRRRRPSNKSSRRYSQNRKNRMKARLHFLAFYLHYRRVKQLRTVRIIIQRRKKITNYRRKMRLVS